jgi:hypothetical protein
MANNKQYRVTHVWLYAKNKKGNSDYKLIADWGTMLVITDIKQYRADIKQAHGQNISICLEFTEIN